MGRSSGRWWVEQVGRKEIGWARARKLSFITNSYDYVSSLARICHQCNSRTISVYHPSNIWHLYPRSWLLIAAALHTSIGFVSRSDTRQFVSNLEFTGVSRGMHLPQHYDRLGQQLCGMQSAHESIDKQSTNTNSNSNASANTSVHSIH